MGDTAIEWTDKTWNPVRGCSRVSEGCRHCYAERRGYRFSGPGLPYEGLVQLDAAGKPKAQWNGQVRFVEKHLLDPLRWKKPARIFVNSMSDLFHEGLTDAQLGRIFAVMALCPQHTFQVLTKRPERMLAYLSAAETSSCIVTAMEAIVAEHDNARNLLHVDLIHALTTGMPLPNVWLGVSVENQKAADERIPLLLQTPAAVRFISAEPLLGPVRLDGGGYSWFSCHATDGERAANDGYCCDVNMNARGTPFRDTHYHGIDWVIVGGESGSAKDVRPMHPDWARSLRDQCVAAGVPFFFKQWGRFIPWEFDGGYAELRSQAGNLMDRHALPDEAAANRIGWVFSHLFDQDGDLVGFEPVGKKAAGDLLDSKQWHQSAE